MRLGTKSWCHGGTGHYAMSLGRLTKPTVQLRTRCESAMRGLEYDPRIEWGVTSSRLTGLPPVPYLCASSAL